MIQIEELNHHYGERQALKNLSLTIERGEVFGFLGPNGSGKSTLFKILATSFAPSSGGVKVDGLDVVADRQVYRNKIGVVFQSPGLDDKLSVIENLRVQGALYGLSGRGLERKATELLERLGLQDRMRERVAKLSGGLQRRTEIAKGLLHDPELLILDEPSTGLDPGARMELWRYLKTLRESSNVTILVTTHLMDEAEECSRIGILSEGSLVGLGTPAELKAEIGTDVLVIQPHAGEKIEALAEAIRAKLSVTPIVAEGMIQIEHPDGAQFMTGLVAAFPEQIDSVTYRKPMLEDVFLHHTGHRFWTEPQEVAHA